MGATTAVDNKAITTAAHHENLLDCSGKVVGVIVTAVEISHRP
jgi:hypothetical protein